MQLPYTRVSFKYILDGHTPVPIGEDSFANPAPQAMAQSAADLLTWGLFMENAEARRVAKDTIHGVDVSTVFLGINHSFGDGPPILFETMIFGGVLDGEQCRYCTWDEAASGHRDICARVRSRWIASSVVDLYRATAKVISALYKKLKDGK